MFTRRFAPSSVGVLRSFPFEEWPAVQIAVATARATPPYAIHRVVLPVDKSSFTPSRARINAEVKRAGGVPTTCLPSKLIVFLLKKETAVGRSSGNVVPSSFFCCSSALDKLAANDIIFYGN